jgi:hypothetical protein
LAGAAAALAGKLEIQDQHLTQVLDSAAEARQAVARRWRWIAGDGLLAEITAAFQKAAAH